GAFAFAGHVALIASDCMRSTMHVVPQIAWWMPALDWTIALALLWAAPRRLAAKAVPTAADVAQAIAVTALVGVTAVALQAPPRGLVALWPWLTALTIGFATQDLVARRRRGAADAVVLPIRLAAILWRFLGATLAPPLPEAFWLLVVGVALCAVGTRRRSVGLYAAGVFLVLGTYAELYILHVLPDGGAAAPATVLAIV